MSLIDVCMAAFVSDFRAWNEIERLDGEVVAALDAIDRQVAEYFEVNRGRGGFPWLSSYSFAGNGYSAVRGGIIDGPRDISRDVRVTNKVCIDICIRSNWYFFAGTPYVEIRADGSAGNSWFLKVLLEQLEQQDVSATVIELH